MTAFGRIIAIFIIVPMVTFAGGLLAMGVGFDLLWVNLIAGSLGLAAGGAIICDDAS